MRTISSLFIVFILLFGGTALAAVPTTINYQGKLADSGGSPLTTSVNISFSLYTVSSGGTPVWSETQTGVSVSNGIFSVQLGSVVPISSATLTQADLWLGVTVASDAEMTPRQKLTAAPFSINSATADALSANGTNCTAGQYPLGVDASGNAEGCTAAPTAGISVIYSGHGGDVTASQSKYFSVNGKSTGADLALFDTRMTTVPVSCTARNLYVHNFHYNSGSAGQHVVTLYKGRSGSPASTALTCTVSNVGALNTFTTCSDATHSVAVAAGDYLLMHVASTGIAGGTEVTADAGASSISFGMTCD